MKVVYFVPKKISTAPSYSIASSFQLLLLMLLEAAENELFYFYNLDLMSISHFDIE